MTNLKDLKELTNSLKVLYVEDDKGIQFAMVQYLERIFLKVVSASNGLEGLESYKKESFDVVITDLSMPRMNGLDMLREIKAIDEEQAVLVTSAHSESDYMIGAIKVGIDGYIIKPFDYEQLNNEIYKIAQRLRKYAENEQYKKHLKDMVEQKTSEIRYMMEFQSDNYEKTLMSMVEMIEERDTYTAGHSKRVAEYCQRIAREMGYSESECTMLYQAGVLHDVGKIATPDSVLLNPKSLNKIEYKLIQEHVEVSYKLLNNIPMFKQLADIVHSHHERYDGTGYPRGLKDNEIIPLARIMIVADAFDAMTTNRIYKARKTISEALDELIELKEMQFHPEVVDMAVIALKNIIIDDAISQLPKTRLEEERFAYFYKDTLGDTYNQNYLDTVLVRNSYEKEFKYMYVLYLKHFAQYNKKNSWSEGDKLLHDFATVISEFFENSLVFRVFGDDFVVMSREAVNIEKLIILLDKLAISNGIEYQTKSIDLKDVKIDNIFQIEDI